MADQTYFGMTFEETVQKYAPIVHSACVMRLGNAYDADDCFQNTFLKLYTDAPGFREEEHLKAWLLRVAINECRRYIRDNRRTVPLDSARGMLLPATEDANDISWALMRLEPKYREVLYLYYAEGYSGEEIAEILGKNPATVRTMMRRGREKLKKIYGGDNGE
jgi:RNA polymerase sigma-70 factor (ECF subfamily)